jgi:hypothetical protein
VRRCSCLVSNQTPHRPYLFLLLDFFHTGNPAVQFYNDIAPDHPTVSLDGNFVPVLGDRFYYSDVENEMLQLTSNLTDGNCEGLRPPGAPAQVIVGTTTDIEGTQYWIHTTSFELQNNDVGSPLGDGGKAFILSTADSPSERMTMACSSAPRSFLNEDQCIMSNDACYAQEGPDVDIALSTSNLKKIWVCT